ncbi:MAG: hypothetical protein IPK93_04425 [Solirubrobacterales bacterium]|nr:hypothetical protein [Solirubrobacterales bacterium]
MPAGLRGSGGVLMVAAVILAPALIAGDQWHATQVEELRNSPALLWRPWWWAG